MHKNIVEDLSMVEEVRVPRTWKQRLFSGPWNPFRTVDIVLLPSRDVIVFGDRLVMHPETAKLYRAKVIRQNETACFGRFII